MRKPAAPILSGAKKLQAEFAAGEGRVKAAKKKVSANIAKRAAKRRGPNKLKLPTGKVKLPGGLR